MCLFAQENLFVFDESLREIVQVVDCDMFSIGEGSLLGYELRKYR